MQLPASLLSLCLLVSAIPSEGARPNDKNFTAAEVEPYGCEETCQANVRQGEQADRELFQGYPFDYDFYATASNFSNAQPGDVLKLEQANVSTLSVPPSLAAYKLQYVSVGLDGEKVPTTAFVTLPFTAGQGRKSRLVAFAHGTIATVAGCAPSSSYNYYDYYTWQMLSIAGYAVVGTDYAGLGNNNTSHKYLNPVLNGEDAYWSVIAARRAFPDAFTRRWASMGHSQGGGTVWGLSENEKVAGTESGEYIGGVAIAPSPRIYDLSVNSPITTKVSSFLPLIADAVRAVNPPSTKIDFMSDAALERAKLIDILQLCLHGAGALNADLPLGGLRSLAVLQDSKQLRDFQDIYGAALGKKGFKDLLVLQGTADKTVNYNVTQMAYHTACKAGNPVRLSLYPGLGHRPVLTAGAPEWMAWLEERFNGAPAARGCDMHRVEPLQE